MGKIKPEQLVGDEMVLPYFLGDDSEEAAQRAFWWAYGNNAGAAYSYFLDFGRGFLWGPIPTDLDDNLLDHSALTTAVAAGQGVKLLMGYTTLEELFKDFFPFTLPADLREMILASVKKYDPKCEINLLFRRADGQWGSFIGRFGQGGFMRATPAEFYEASQKGMSLAEFYNAQRQKIQPN